MLFPLTTFLMAQNVTGKVVNGKGEPLPYVNVILLNAQDSSFVKGTISNEDGCFSLDIASNKGFLKFSTIGYQALFVALDGEKELGEITLTDDSYELAAVVVKSKLPKTTLSDGGVITMVSGTILEKTGNIYNLLDLIPQLIVREQKVEVFGRGEPVFYINGRIVKDMTELEQLHSEEVKSIEVINNPGVKYEASTKAVVRIVLKKKKGEGFGVNARSFGAINEKNRTSGYEQVNLNYLKSRLGVSATFFARESHQQDNKDLQQYTFSDNTLLQKNKLVHESKYQQLFSRLEATYCINSDNSIGTSFRYSRMPDNNGLTEMETTVTNDQKVTENSYSKVWTPNQATSVSSNMYYVGKIGNVGIDFNLDWLWNKKKEYTRTVESYQEIGQNVQNIQVNSKNNTRNSLIASKMFMTIPIGKGTFSIGGEYSKCNRANSYFVVPQNILEDKDGHIEEELGAGFMEYKRNIGTLKVQLGLRYEQVNYNYHEDESDKFAQKQVYKNILPSLVLSWPLGNWRMQLGYGTDIQRPSYYEMRNSIQYDNKYTYEAGNPFLVSQLSRNVNYDLAYKWISVNMLYSHVSDPLLLFSQPYKENSQVALVQTINWDSFDILSASFNISPKIGIWSPSCRFMIQKQWFDMKTHANHNLNHIMGSLRISNTFDTKYFTTTLSMNIQTTGDDKATYYNKGYFCANLSIYKSMLKHRLTIYFDANNLFGTGNSSRKLYSGMMREIRYHNFSTSIYSLTVSYHFNSIKNRYKGSGAGKEQRNRI